MRWLISIIAFIYLATPLVALEAPVPEKTEVSIDSRELADLTPESLKQYLWAKGTEMGLSEAEIGQIEDTIGGVIGTLCPHGESAWKINAVGDDGQSYGLAQIHLPSNPDVTRAEAEDPIFSLNFIIDGWLEGRQERWTCYNLIYGKRD